MTTSKKFSIENLPSNENFGVFFGAVLSGLALLTYYQNKGAVLVGSLAFVAAAFFLTSQFSPRYLLPLNRLWKALGDFLGSIVSPVVLGILFFLFVTPIAIVLRLSGRDELRLKKCDSASFWTHRDDSSEKMSFKRQY